MTEFLYYRIILQEFWSQLEQDWQEEDHPWLSDYSATYEPFKDYQFQVWPIACR